MKRLGFDERTQGKTSGSRVGFYRVDDVDGQIYFEKLEGISDLVTVDDYISFRRSLAPHSQAG